MKRILSAALILMLSLQFLFAFANTPMLITSKAPVTKVFKDVDEGAWYYADVMNAYELNLINGKNSPDTFLPNDNMTYAEAIKLAACMNQLYTTGAVTLENGNPWYQNYVDYCKGKEIIKKDYDYSQLVTRAGYMEIFANALPSEALNKINSVPDDTIPDVPSSEEYAPAVYKLYRAGILAGSEEHKCKPLDNIKRSEVAAILSRMMNSEKRLRFTTGDDESILTFAIFSDVHNSKSPFDTMMKNIMTLSNDGKDLDGLLLVGDIVYFQADDKPDPSFYSMINSNEHYTRIKNEGKLVFNMGNHEFPLNDNTEETTNACRELFTEQVGQEPEAHIVLGGYHFIVAGPKDYAGGLNTEQERYVMKEVKEALRDGDEKPVFVLLHHPVDGTLMSTSSTNRQSAEFEEFLKKEPRLVVISAHNHYPLSDPHSIYQVPGGATFMYSSTIMGGNGLSSVYATERHSSYPTQGYMMKINSETNVITFKRFYMSSSNPTYLEGGDWVVDIPAMIKDSKKTIADTENVYIYTYDERSAKSVAPYFKDGDEITIKSLKEKKATINYPVATPGAEGEDNYVAYYKIELYNKATKETVTHKVISDYFLSSKKAVRGYTFSNLTPDTDYTVTITPVNTWYKEGTSKITTDFKTLAPEFEEVALVDSTIRDYSIYEAEGTIKNTPYDDYIQINAGRGGTMSFAIGVNEPGTYRVILVASGTDAELRMSLTQVEYGEKVVDGVAEEIITKEDELIKDKKITISTDGMSYFDEIVCFDFEAKAKGDYIVKFKKNSTNSAIGIKCLSIGKHAE